MLFSDASPTPYDLRFEIFGFPVRVHPGFWVIGLILGMNYPPPLVPIWIGAVFVSVLVHELGHAVAQRCFGGRPWIVLYTFGGVAAEEGVDRAWWKNVLIALAGPCAGFALAALVFALTASLGEPSNDYAYAATSFLLFINVAWGVINLAPIWPLDGGRVAREVLTRFLNPSTGIVASLWLSVVSAGLVAAWLWVQTESLWNLVLFGMLGYQSYQTLVAYRQARGRW